LSNQAAESDSCTTRTYTCGIAESRRILWQSSDTSIEDDWNNAKCPVCIVYVHW